jgi:hypothetical protein
MMEISPNMWWFYGDIKKYLLVLNVGNGWDWVAGMIIDS